MEILRCFLWHTHGCGKVWWAEYNSLLQTTCLLVEVWESRKLVCQQHWQWLDYTEAALKRHPLHPNGGRHEDTKKSTVSVATSCDRRWFWWVSVNLSSRGILSNNKYVWHVFCHQQRFTVSDRHQKETPCLPAVLAEEEEEERLIRQPANCIQWCWPLLADWVLLLVKWTMPRSVFHPSGPTPAQLDYKLMPLSEVDQSLDDKENSIHPTRAAETTGAFESSTFCLVSLHGLLGCQGDTIWRWSCTSFWFVQPARSFWDIGPRFLVTSLRS